MSINQPSVSYVKNDLHYPEAMYIGSVAVNRMTTEERYCVHSVFRRVVNILNSRKHLISIVRKDVENGPINIVTDLPEYVDMTSMGIKSHHVVTLGDESINVGRGLLVISTRNAKRYKPRKDFRYSLLTLSEIEDNLYTLQEVVRTYGRFNGLGQLVGGVDERCLETTMAEKMNSFTQLGAPLVSTLLRAIARGELETVKVCAQRLIGLGPGLTPSGDDLLAGLMTSLSLMAVNLNVSTDLASNVNKTIVASLSGRTTVISHEYLMLASSGEANESIMTLLEKMLTGRNAEVAKAARSVLSIGDSSGTDLVFGIVLGSRLILNRIQPSCELWKPSIKWRDSFK